MKTINLDTTNDELMRPIKTLLQTLVESHTIIERYTQPTVLNILNSGINPLTVMPQLVERIIIFGDIVSYSLISETLTLDHVMLLLNTYFEICSRVIMRWGGEINKFIGDSVMAYFPVDHADQAIHACADILAELAHVQATAGTDSPLQLLYTGFGMAHGTVIEGNMGSAVKMDYTIIGDAVNVAARLEGLTRQLEHALVLSDTVKQHTREDWDFVSLGTHELVGKQSMIELYSIDNPLVRDFEAKTLIHQLIQRFDSAPAS